MKSLYASAVSIILILGLYAFSAAPSAGRDSSMLSKEGETDLSVPDEIQAILDNSCLPCHGPDGKFKAKLKFNWENLFEMDKSGQISKLSKIVDEVSENKMPPPKFVKKNPDKALSDEQQSALTSWAESQAEKLVSGQ